MIIGTGWKMNKTVREAVDYTVALLRLLDGIKGLGPDVQVFVVPPFTALEAVKKHAAGRIWVGAQNMHWAEAGAFTGEISAPMLQELGVDLVELGHSERRRYFNEQDPLLNQKVHLALKFGLRPLLCVGESLEEKQVGVAPETVGRQLRIALHGVSAAQASRLLVAYEPFWAIGEGGIPAEPPYVRSLGLHLRSILGSLFGEAGAHVPVLYGGSVNVANAADLFLQGQMDGLFIGRAAWQAENFARIIRDCVGKKGSVG